MKELLDFLRPIRNIIIFAIIVFSVLLFSDAFKNWKEINFVIAQSNAIAQKNAELVNQNQQLIAYIQRLQSTQKEIQKTE